MDSIHRGNEENEGSEGNEGNVYRMPTLPTLPTFKTAMTATWKYSNFLLKPLESNRIQIEDGKNWFTIWDFLFKHGFLINFLSPFCLNKTSKIYHFDLWNLSKSHLSISRLQLGVGQVLQLQQGLRSAGHNFDVALGSASRIEMIETWLKHVWNFVATWKTRSEQMWHVKTWKKLDPMWSRDCSNTIRLKWIISDVVFVSNDHAFTWTFGGRAKTIANTLEDAKTWRIHGENFGILITWLTRAARIITVWLSMSFTSFTFIAPRQLMTQNPCFVCFPWWLAWHKSCILKRCPMAMGHQGWSQKTLRHFTETLRNLLGPWEHGSMGPHLQRSSGSLPHPRRWNFLWVLNASTVVRLFPHNFGTIWTMFENSGSVVSFLIKRILSHALRYKRVFGKPLITLQGTVHLFGPSCRLPLFGIDDSASTNSRGQFRWNRSKSEGTMVIYIRKKGGRKILSKISSEYPMVTSFGTY